MGLWAFVARRVVLALFILVIVSIATFLLAHAVPGDPITAILSERQANNPEVRAALEKRWGLDKPLPIQYVYYVANLLRGDWGESISKRTPVAQELRARVPATVELSSYALAFAVVVGVPSASSPPSITTAGPIMLLASSHSSGPRSRLGLLCCTYFSTGSNGSPDRGRLDVGMAAPPTITGMVSRRRDSRRLGCIRSGPETPGPSVDRPRLICHGHPRPHAPFVTSRIARRRLCAHRPGQRPRRAIGRGRTCPAERADSDGDGAGLTTAGLLAGAVLTETIFSWPGVGSFAVSAAVKLDYPALLGVTLVVAIIYVFVNLVIDIIYGLLDPRIRSS